MSGTVGSATEKQYVRNYQFIKPAEVGGVRPFVVPARTNNDGDGTGLAKYDYYQKPSYTNTGINSRYDTYTKKHVQTNFDITG